MHDAFPSVSWVVRNRCLTSQSSSKTVCNSLSRRSGEPSYPDVLHQRCTSAGKTHRKKGAGDSRCVHGGDVTWGREYRCGSKEVGVLMTTNSRRPSLQADVDSWFRVDLYFERGSRDWWLFWRMTDFCFPAKTEKSVSCGCGDLHTYLTYSIEASSAPRHLGPPVELGRNRRGGEGPRWDSVSSRRL